jgi:predicted metal-dependent enzyme (double-stranded beta helix superfamily)
VSREAAMKTALRRDTAEVLRYTFEDFISDLHLVTASQEDQAEIIRIISRKMRLLMSGPGDFLTPPEREPNPRHYARHLIYIDRHRRFVVTSCVWEPGQGTPIHDHGTWGVMGVLEGELKVTNYVRLDDRSRPGYAELREASGLICPPGAVSYVLPPNEEIHKVENLSDATTVSLHVYGKDIVECNMFDLAGKTYRPYSVEYTSQNRADGQ